MNLVGPVDPVQVGPNSGHWNSICSPRVVAYGDYVYIGYITSSGDVLVCARNTRTRRNSTPVLLASGLVSVSGNGHNSVALLVRSSDQKLLAAYVAEGGAQVGIRISTNSVTTDPTLSGGFGSQSLVLTSSVYTYCALAELTSEPAIYMFMTHWVSGNGDVSYAKSTDNGATWTTVTDVAKPDSTTVIYFTLATNGTNRIDLFVTSTNRAAATPSSTYHMYMTGGSFYKSDGTLISATKPFVASSGTLVQGTSLGSCWSAGWAYDSGGNPACLIVVNDANGGTNTLVRSAVWSGSAWSVNPIVSQNGVVPGNVFQAHPSLVKSDPYTAYIPVKVGSYFEIYRYVSVDSGANWTGTRLTNSAADNIMVDTPVNADSYLAVLWSTGDFTDDWSFAMGIRMMAS